MLDLCVPAQTNYLGLENLIVLCLTSSASIAEATRVGSWHLAALPNTQSCSASIVQDSMLVLVAPTSLAHSVKHGELPGNCTALLPKLTVTVTFPSHLPLKT